MRPFLNPSYPASDTASADDREFFARRRWRRYRARPFHEGELCQGVVLFEAGENGEAREVNLVIIRQVRPGARVRFASYAPCVLMLDSDEKIERFLRARGIDPDATVKIPSKQKGVGD
jgi:hypothetical protein